MREEDIHIFQQAASHTNSWVLLRQTNVFSLGFIGRADCAPKPMICKFKTASRDSGNKRTAGLVVSFEIHPNAFAEPESAGAIWNTDAARYHLTSRHKPFHKPGYGFGIDLDKGSVYYGCLTLDGKYLFGDYDLFDVIRPGDESRNMGMIVNGPNGPAVVGIHHYKVMEFINSAIGVDMIQHSNSALYKRKFEDVYVFTPTGRIEQWSAITVREHYRKWKRRLIDTFRQEVAVPLPTVNPDGAELTLLK